MDVKRRIYSQLLRSPNRTPECMYHVLCFVLDEHRVTFLGHLFDVDPPEESSLYQLGQALLHNQEHMELVDCIVYYPNKKMQYYLYKILCKTISI